MHIIYWNIYCWISGFQPYFQAVQAVEEQKLVSLWQCSYSQISTDEMNTSFLKVDKVQNKIVGRPDLAGELEVEITDVGILTDRVAGSEFLDFHQIFLFDIF